jgi:hypothetical protein
MSKATKYKAVRLEGSSNKLEIYPKNSHPKNKTVTMHWSNKTSFWLKMLALELPTCYKSSKSWNIKNMVSGYEDERVQFRNSITCYLLTE